MRCTLLRATNTVPTFMCSCSAVWIPERPSERHAGEQSISPGPRMCSISLRQAPTSRDRTCRGENQLLVGARRAEPDTSRSHARAWRREVFRIQTAEQLHMNVGQCRRSSKVANACFSRKSRSSTEGNMKGTLPSLPATSVQRPTR